jgi:hypothetical protein
VLAFKAYSPITLTKRGNTDDVVHTNEETSH